MVYFGKPLARNSHVLHIAYLTPDPFRPMECVLSFVNAHVEKHIIIRFLGSTSEARKIEQIRQKLNGGMHYFTVSTLNYRVECQFMIRSKFRFKFIGA